MFIYETIFYLNSGLKHAGLISMIISVMIILSDFIDGKLARRYEVSTKIGQEFDVYLDFAYIISALVTLYFYNITHLYFILIVIYKFLEFVLFSKLMKAKIEFQGCKGRNYFYDMPGTIASGAYYIMPLIILSLKFFEFVCIREIINIISLLITVFTIISSIIKIKNTASMLKINYQTEVCRNHEEI